jgi:hypothetical protein
MSVRQETEDGEIETAAAVIEDLLFMVSPEKRAAVLTRALEVETAESAKRATNPFGLVDFSDDSWKQSPGFRYWHCVMRFKARVIYTFTRDITNNHSEEDATKLLFSQQRGRPGSGYLEHYLDGVMPKREMQCE